MGDCEFALLLTSFFRERESYDLFGVIMHLGSSPNAGHYYACGRDSSASSDAEWVSFDDSFTSRMSFRSVQRTMQSLSADSPYILFYSRRERGEEGGKSERIPRVNDMEIVRKKREHTNERVAESEAYHEWWRKERSEKEMLSRLPSWVQSEVMKANSQLPTSSPSPTPRDKDDDGDPDKRPFRRNPQISFQFTSHPTDGWRHDRWGGGGGGGVF